MAVVGILLWGAVLGIQESTMRAAVADLVPTECRGTSDLDNCCPTLG